MKNEVIFWTQIASILGYVILLFGLYRLLVAAKDGTIEMLKQRIEKHKERIAELENLSPDVLVERLSKNLDIYKKELESVEAEKKAFDEGQRRQLETIRALQAAAANFGSKYNEAKEAQSSPIDFQSTLARALTRAVWPRRYYCTGCNSFVVQAEGQCPNCGADTGLGNFTIWKDDRRDA